MKRSWIFASLLAAGLATQGAHAAVISLDLTTTANPDLANNCNSAVVDGGSNGNRGCLENGDTASAGGLTLTFSSVTPHQSGLGSYIMVDEDGIWFDSDRTDASSLPTAGSFGISFSQDLYIKSYFVGFSTTATNTDGGFSIAAGSGSLNSMVGVGTKDFAAPNFLFMANTVYTVVGSAFDLATLKTLNVETVGASVPEPGTLALLAVGLAGLGLGRRRKAA